ncbi:MAG: glutathione S-transferase family protein, partial [Nannocystaceae bacterium]
MHNQHFGWPVSPYSAKTRAYLRWKQIPFTDVEVGALRLFTRIRKAVGRAVMPTVLRPDGTWLQDSSEIIDTFEREFPTPSILPTGPRQRIASLLIELHADEWLPIVAMFTRWTIPENREFARNEFARSGFPRMPKFLSRRLIAPVAEKMAAYLPILGVSEATGPGINAFTQTLIATLNTHFQVHPYLLGSRPCLGDFALYGPLWAHCYRDPGSRHYFADAPAVVEWFERLTEPPSPPVPGVFLAADEVPDTLDPIFSTLFREQWPYIQTLIQAIEAWCSEHPHATRVPRALGNCDFEIGGHTGTRRLITFTQWMAQRPLAAYAELTDNDRKNVDTWLARCGGAGA